MKKAKSSYYIAYGSNLNIEQMKYRCPGATVVGSTILNNHRLLFRGAHGNTHATVEPARGYSVPVLIWTITAEHEAELDRYEGYPRYYCKEYFTISINKKIEQAMIYVMTDGKELGTPSEYYLNVIETGYESAGFDYNILDCAVKESESIHILK